MLLLYRENGILYVESKLDLRFPVEYKGKTYERNVNETYQDIDLVEGLLKLNANVLIKKDDKFIKPSLYWLGMALLEKKYDIVEGLPVMGESANIVDIFDEEASNPTTSEVGSDEELEQSTETEDEEEYDNRNENQGKNRKKRNNNNQEGDK